jgi:hypothetical protein
MLTPTSKTRDFIEQYCFILTSKFFFIEYETKYQKVTQERLFFYEICKTEDF